MKPWHILVFFLLVILSLAGVGYFFPDEGIRLAEGMELKFFKPGELIRGDSSYYADISNILENTELDTREELEELPPDISADEMTVPPEILIDTVRADPDSLKKITHLIEFPDNGKLVFYRFFNRMKNLSDSKELIRILHYGDSQIETDRISGPVRNRLQKKFGGSGPGLVPPVPLYKGKMSVAQDFSKEWERYTGFGKIDTTRGHNSYGALISYAAYDTTSVDSACVPWISLRPSPIAYSTARRFNKVSLYLSKKNRKYLDFKVFVNDSLVDEIQTDEALNYNKISWTLDQTPESFTFKFRGKGSPELYGVSLDNSWGVAFDNIPLRGSAGLVFSKNDTVQLRQMYEDLNVGMIILQFGGNVVPYMEDAKVYKRIFKRELEVIRSLAPDAAVLVVGPSDMSQKLDGKYVTYSNLEKIRNAMKSASFEAGYAFWDMYEAMGGRNSMPSWVFAEPPLAINDFVHFNAKGAAIMAEMLYNALIYEYNSWEMKNKSQPGELKY